MDLELSFDRISQSYAALLLTFLLGPQIQQLQITKLQNYKSQTKQIYLAAIQIQLSLVSGKCCIVSELCVVV